MAFPLVSRKKNKRCLFDSVEILSSLEKLEYSAAVDKAKRTLELTRVL